MFLFWPRARRFLGIEISKFEISRLAVQRIRGPRFVFVLILFLETLGFCSGDVKLEL